MSKNALVNKNKHLKDPDNRRRLIARSVVTSSGVEGVEIDLSAQSYISIPRRPKKMHARFGA